MSGVRRLVMLAGAVLVVAGGFSAGWTGADAIHPAVYVALVVGLVVWLMAGLGFGWSARLDGDALVVSTIVGPVRLALDGLDYAAYFRSRSEGMVRIGAGRERVTVPGALDAEVAMAVRAALDGAVRAGRLELPRRVADRFGLRATPGAGRTGRSGVWPAVVLGGVTIVLATAAGVVAAGR